MFFGPFQMIVFIGIVVAVVALVIRWLNNTVVGHSLSTSSVRDPLDILKKRFACGDIEKEEYEERCRILRDDVS